MSNLHATDPNASCDASTPFQKKISDGLQSLRSFRRNAPKRVFAPVPQTSQQRLDATQSDQPFDTESLVSSLDTNLIQEKEKTVLYLAYGSNLCDETFRGVRGIQPLSQVNVLVPSLRLTFDLPGIPYSEPCFANTAHRTAEDASSSKHTDGRNQDDYHKNRWHKGLVGVVYEVTKKDYAHIIATEGGGSAYQDILVDCYVLPPTDTVPTTPTTTPFKAHTLFAPVQNNNDDDGGDDEDNTTQSFTIPTTTDNGRTTRPDPSYAQPSARYLNLITSGAAERALPSEYQDYLHSIRPYTITSRKQAAGKAIFLALWMPFVIFIFTVSRRLQDKRGRAPWWFAKLSAWIFAGMWVSYDKVFKEVFGDGERTVGDDGKDGDGAGEAVGGVRRRSYVRGEEADAVDYAEKEALLKGAVEVMQGQQGRRGSLAGEWKLDSV